MQYDANTPEEYMDLLKPDWRKGKIIELRKILKSLWPELKEGIEYKMLCFAYGEKNIFHLNAQAAYVSFYVGNIDKIENARTLLKEFNMGKGCIRIKKSINLSDT
jgi:uncharacterized protein YdhG (YjbR/CyaY superfamily)